MLPAISPGPGTDTPIVSLPSHLSRPRLLPPTGFMIAVIYWGRRPT